MIKRGVTAFVPEALNVIVALLEDKEDEVANAAVCGLSPVSCQIVLDSENAAIYHFLWLEARRSSTPFRVQDVCQASDCVVYSNWYLWKGIFCVASGTNNDMVVAVLFRLVSCF